MIDLIVNDLAVSDTPVESEKKTAPDVEAVAVSIVTVSRFTMIEFDYVVLVAYMTAPSVADDELIVVDLSRVSVALS